MLGNKDFDDFEFLPLQHTHGIFSDQQIIAAEEMLTSASDSRLPAIFVGHGSPALVLEEDDASVLLWEKLGKELPRPKAILSISAHWFINETSVTAQIDPDTIHDFYNFPKEMYDIRYPAPGDPALAERVSQIVSKVNNGVPAKLDDKSWGLDHGTWCVLRKMYPEADIPVVQLSIDENESDQYYYEIGLELAKLRDEGILIFGSGNLVHNFAYLSRDPNAPVPKWASDFTEWIKGVTNDKSVDRKDAANYPLLHWKEHPSGERSQMSPDHFVPSLFVLGTAENDEPISWVGEKWDLGTLYMGCFVVGAHAS